MYECRMYPESPFNCILVFEDSVCCHASKAFNFTKDITTVVMHLTYIVSTTVVARRVRIHKDTE
jgi:hypothetical protein